MSIEAVASAADALAASPLGQRLAVLELQDPPPEVAPPPVLEPPSVIVKEWQDEARLKQLADDVLSVLRDRCGPVPSEVEAKIESAADLALLQRWLLAAAKADSLDRFRQDANC